MLMIPCADHLLPAAAVKITANTKFQSYVPEHRFLHLPESHRVPHQHPCSPVHELPFQLHALSYFPSLSTHYLMSLTAYQIHYACLSPFLYMLFYKSTVMLSYFVYIITKWSFLFFSSKYQYYVPGSTKTSCNIIFCFLILWHGK